MLALWASRVGKKTDVLTGTVIDSGDGVTHVIPVVHGYPIGSLIKTMDIAGKDITRFVQVCTCHPLPHPRTESRAF